MTNINVGESPSKAEISTFRLYLMRFIYLLNFVLVGFNAWAVLIKHDGNKSVHLSGAACVPQNANDKGLCLRITAQTTPPALL